MSLFSELNRRNVFRVAIAYMALAWLLTEVAGTLFPAFGVPDWGLRFLVLVFALGFVPALIISWVYELTPEGIKREKDVVREASITHITGRRLDVFTIGLIVVALSFVLFDRLWLSPRAQRPAAPAAAALTESLQTAAPAQVEPQYPPNSIAVLPFVNMSDDPGNEYFSDGISEEILNLLARQSGLHVTSRSSSFQFKGQYVGIPKVAQKLGVSHVLEGSVRKAGNRVRITAELIAADEDRPIWSESYDRELVVEDIFAIQDTIARSVIAAMKSTLLGGDEITRSGNTHNLAAYDHYLQGRYFWSRRNAKDLLYAAQLLEKAVEIDPNYADAWAALGAVYVVIPPYLRVEQGPYIKKAMMAARRALELDSMQAEAYAVLASCYLDEYRWSKAVQFITKAIELDPKNATAHHWAYVAYISIGWVSAAHQEITEAYRLDPLNAAIAGSLGWSYSVSGEYEKAIKALETAKELGWGSYASLYVALNHALKGDIEVAAKLYAEIGESRDFSNYDWAPSFLAALQDHRHVDQFADQMIKMVEAGDAWGFSVFPMLVLLGSETFPRVLANRSYIWALWYQDASAIRQTQTFRKLAENFKLVEYWHQSGRWPDMCEPISDKDFECD